MSEFKKSKAALGSITAVDRTRVAELQNPDEDKPLAAHWRVSRRLIFSSHFKPCVPVCYLVMKYVVMGLDCVRCNNVGSGQLARS